MTTLPASTDREAPRPRALLALLRLVGVASTAWLGWPVAALAATTVVATAMIYAQMKTVPRWRSPLVPASFVLAALGGGALLAGLPVVAAGGLAVLGGVQIGLWWQGDRGRRRPRSTLASATGLGAMGRLRLFEPPHTGSNYLLREMVFTIGRRHAGRLRAAGLGLAVLLPVALVLALPAEPLAAGMAAAVHLAGMLVLRWLFFAEAEHVVGLYYGRG